MLLPHNLHKPKHNGGDHRVCQTATHCTALQRNATHRNPLQSTAIHRNTLQHTATQLEEVTGTASIGVLEHCSTPRTRVSQWPTRDAAIRLQTVSLCVCKYHLNRDAATYTHTSYTHMRLHTYTRTHTHTHTSMHTDTQTRTHTHTLTRTHRAVGCT